MSICARKLCNIALYLVLVVASVMAIGPPELSDRQADSLIRTARWLDVNPDSLFVLMVLCGHMLIALAAMMLIRLCIKRYQSHKGR